MKRGAVLIVAIVLIISGIAFYNSGIVKSSIDPALKQVLDMPGVKRGTTDAFGEINCTTAKDVGFKLEDGGDIIQINYGTQKFYIKRDTLDEEYVKDALKLLRLKIENKDSTISIKYKGEEVSEWAN